MTTLKGTDLYGTPSSAEDAMKIGAVRPDCQDTHSKHMYFEAAKKVLFKNCMEHCELEPEQIPNFNSNFYYNMLGEQKCLESCYNTKMNLHFGETTAKEEHLYMDFARMKAEYQRYENWHP